MSLVTVCQVLCVFLTAMAPVIAKMLRKSDGKQCNAGVRLTRQGSFREERTPENEKVDLKRKFLSDLVLLLNHSKLNRRYGTARNKTDGFLRAFSRLMVDIM